MAVIAAAPSVSPVVTPPPAPINPKGARAVPISAKIPAASTLKIVLGTSALQCPTKDNTATGICPGLVVVEEVPAPGRRCLKCGAFYPA